MLHWVARHQATAPRVINTTPSLLADRHPLYLLYGWRHFARLLRPVRTALSCVRVGTAAEAAPLYNRRDVERCAPVSQGGAVQAAEVVLGWRTCLPAAQPAPCVAGLESAVDRCRRELRRGVSAASGVFVLGWVVLRQPAPSNMARQNCDDLCGWIDAASNRQGSCQRQPVGDARRWLHGSACRPLQCGCTPPLLISGGCCTPQ